ncbi:MAG: ribonuclease P protein component 1 [Thermoplasmata archaeon]
MITNENIARHELIGLTASVINAADKNMIGTNGMVTDETKNTLVIRNHTTTKEKRIPKMDSIFRFQTENGEVDVSGSVIVCNPADRVKKIKSGRF